MKSKHMYRQTSIRSGNVLGMGKGFHCSDAVRGHDLGDIIEQACRRIVRTFPFNLGNEAETIAETQCTIKRNRQRFFFYASCSSLLRSCDANRTHIGHGIQRRISYSCRILTQLKIQISPGSRRQIISCLDKYGIQHVWQADSTHHALG